MLDLNHVLATPGLDAQYFQGPGWAPGPTLTVSGMSTGGVLTVTAGNYQVGQVIQITGAQSTGSITGYNSGAYYYIITVASTTSITISATPGGAAVTSTLSAGAPGQTFTFMTPRWQTWRKPRGIKWVYMIGVGAGASGGTGTTANSTSGGAAGGGSGSQTVVMIPAMFVPDILYIACGNGGDSSSQPVVAQSTGTGLGGTPTCVAIEPYTGMDFNKNLLWANPGAQGSTTIPTITAGGPAGTAATAATISQMPLAGRGFYSQLAGQAGSAGGASTAPGGNVTVPFTGLMVTGGTGGGGCNAATGFASGSIVAPTGILGQDFYATLNGASAAVTSTPAGRGTNFIARNFIMNYGGTGGGGGTNTVGGFAGDGAPGAPGCGGGGGGGPNNQNNVPVGKSGAGGPGFVLILSW